MGCWGGGGIFAPIKSLAVWQNLETPVWFFSEKWQEKVVQKLNSTFMNVWKWRAWNT